MFKINRKGFKLIDRMVDACSKYGMYTILDLHSVPGGHNQDWHSASGIHKALFWDFKLFQDVVLNLWKALAAHYKDNKWVAGYNPLNEPASPDHKKLASYYDQLEKTSREIDPHHSLFLDGNTYASDFRQCPDTVWPNTVYSIHDYTLFGFPAMGSSEGKEEQMAKLKSQYDRKLEYMRKHNVPDPDAINHTRYNVLKDQLAIYKSGDPSGDGSPISWSIWLWKDIGCQGMSLVNPDSKKLGLDRWGNDIDPKYGKLYADLLTHFQEHIPEKYYKALYPGLWTMKDYISRVTRDMLFSQYSQYEYADLYADLSFEDLDELTCFKFENCVRRDELK